MANKKVSDAQQWAVDHPLEFCLRVREYLYEESRFVKVKVENTFMAKLDHMKLPETKLFEARLMALVADCNNAPTRYKSTKHYQCHPASRSARDLLAMYYGVYGDDKVTISDVMRTLYKLTNRRDRELEGGLQVYVSTHYCGTVNKRVFFNSSGYVMDIYEQDELGLTFNEWRDL